MDKIKNVIEGCCSQVREHWNSLMNEMIEMLETSLNGQLEMNKMNRELLMNRLKRYLKMITIHQTKESKQLTMQFLQNDDKNPLIPVDKLSEMLAKQFSIILQMYRKEIANLNEMKTEFNASTVDASFNFGGFHVKMNFVMIQIIYLIIIWVCNFCFRGVLLFFCCCFF